MAGPDDVEVLSGLELAEPSPAVDRAILLAAGERLRGRSTFLMALLRQALTLAAAAAAGLIILFSLPSERTPSVGTAGPAPIEEIRELRGDIEEIDEMAELIPSERGDERVALKERIKLCLLGLEELEARVGMKEESSVTFPMKKEAKL
jgi:hypothetical protein